jgi:hypothetical protein
MSDTGDCECLRNAEKMHEYIFGCASMRTRCNTLRRSSARLCRIFDADGDGFIVYEDVYK